MKKVEPESVAHEEEPFILDVRHSVEYRQTHVPGSYLLPLHLLDPEKVRQAAGGKPVHVLCQSGNRASRAAKKLEAAGLPEVSVIKGGVKAWEIAGLPVKHEKGVVSLDRQAQIVAGFLVITGVTLALVVHPLWTIFSALIGAGLMFAGISDSCLMGELIGRMPWNNTKEKLGR